MNKHFVACIIGLLQIYSHLNAQHHVLSKNVPLNKDFSDAFHEWAILQPSFEFHSAFQPYLNATFQNFHDTTFKNKSYPKIKSLALSKIFNDAPNKRNQYQIQVLPIMHSLQGYDGQFTSENGIGSQVYFNINNDFTIYALSCLYNSSFPYFMDTSIYNTQLIQNIGFPISAPSNKRYNYLYWNSYVSYTKSYFNFQLGNSKMFIGDGYRSLLLSDIAPAYPYLKLQTNFWHVQYNVFYMLLQHYVPGNALNIFQRKYATMHTLSWNITPQINIVFFENVVWQGTDKNRYRSFDPVYLSPVLFFRPQEYQQGSSDNVMMGLNVSYTIPRKAQIYGQLALDEFYLKEIRAGKGWWANKQGWQLGIYGLNFLSVKNLNVRLEYNEVKPYTYTHGSVSQNYAHYGMPLAHPFGANFREFIIGLNYGYKKWNIRAHHVYAEIGKDSLSTNSNVGQNIFLSYTTRGKEYGNYTLQGIRTYFNHTQVEFSYLLIPVMNMRIQLGLYYRHQNEVNFKFENLWFSGGLTCNVFNFYRDY